MHIYNRVHVLLSTLSYVFRHLIRHLQEKLIACSQLMLHGLITDLMMYCTWVYSVIYNCLKHNVSFNVKLKMVKVAVLKSWINICR